jgi:hypothetical protein
VSYATTIAFAAVPWLWAVGAAPTLANALLWALEHALVFLGGASHAASPRRMIYSVVVTSVAMEIAVAAAILLSRSGQLVVALGMAVIASSWVAEESLWRSSRVAPWSSTSVEEDTTVFSPPRSALWVLAGTVICALGLVLHFVGTARARARDI